MAGILRTQNSNVTFVPKADPAKESARLKLSRAANSRRPALGNVTNHLRRQPQRVAKGKGPKCPAGQENEDPFTGKGEKTAQGTTSFAIFEDAAGPSTRVQPHIQEIQEDGPMQDQENLISGHDLLLHDGIVNLNRIGAPRPLVPLRLDLSCTSEASPMCVDEVGKGHDVSINRPDEFGLDPYFQDIYNYLRATECASRPSKDYMSRQSDVTTTMRNILVDWLIEVGEEYKLQRETLFLAIAYVDRFLSLVGISRPKLQLVGTTSMFIAAKYEEIYPPDVAEFVYITDDTYNRSQVLKMESVILKILDFRVAVPTINWFSERFLNMLNMSEKAKFLTFFLVELSLIEVDKFLDFRPSVIAASAIVITRSILEIDDPWPKHMEQSTSYSLSDLKPCIKLLFSQYTRKDDMPQKAVLEKYKQQKQKLLEICLSFTMMVQRRCEDLVGEQLHGNQKDTSTSIIPMDHINFHNDSASTPNLTQFLG